MAYKTIIFDLDGTAMPSGQDELPSEHMAATVQKYQTQLTLCAATGRSWLHAQPVINKLGLIKPCIISGGTTIVDPTTETVIWQEALSAEASAFLFEATADSDYSLAWAHGLATDTPETQATPPETISVFYVLGVPKTEVEAVVSRLDRADITISQPLSWVSDDRLDLHITSNIATKEHAVIELCHMLDVDPHDVAGVGDGHNDIHLFSAVGHKVAMGNADPRLKVLADEVIADVTQDGLAEFIARQAGDI